MMKFLKGAVAGAVAVGGLLAVSDVATAMPVDNVRPAASAGAGVSTAIQPVYYYGYGYRRRFIYRRPIFVYRRPFYYHRPFVYRRFY